jgi:hypothetical protein
MTYSLNHEFFQYIETELQAYLLGWFYSRASGHIQVRKSDISILHLISNSLGYSGPVRVFSNIAELNISQHVFLTHLKSIGCVQNTKFSSIFPDYIAIQLMPHFIRGIFDSYGRIIIVKQKYLNIHITYNEIFINEFRLYLLNRLNIHTKHYYRYTHTNTLQMMITSTSYAKKFCEWIYRDANYYLERKFKIYQEFKQKGV